MRRLLLFASFFLLMVCAVRGQVRPDQAPIVTNPLGSDAFYSQERGTILRFRLDTLRSYYSASLVDTVYLSNDTIYLQNGDGGTYSIVLPSGGVSTSTLADSTAAVRADFPDISGLATQSALVDTAAAIRGDFPSGAASIFKVESTSTDATAGTTDNYHVGDLAVGDFSATTIAADFHVWRADQAVLRLSDDGTVDSTTLAFIEFYRGASTYKLGDFGFLDNTDQHIHIRNNLSGGGISFATGGSIEKAVLLASGQWHWNLYGDSSFVETAPIHFLAVDDDGYIGEVNVSETKNPAVTSPTVSGTTTINLNNKDEGIFYVNLSSRVNTILEFTNPWNGGRYSLWIEGVDSDTITFPNNFLSRDRDSLLSEVATTNEIIDFWYDGTNFITPDTVWTRTGVSAPTFSPDDLASLFAWYDASQEGYSNSASVSTINDFSGNNFDVSQGTAGNQATFVTGVVNSKPVFRFDGTDDYYTRTALSALASGEDFAVFAVVAADPTEDVRAVWSTADPGDTDDKRVVTVIDTRAAGSPSLHSTVKTDDGAVSTTLGSELSGSQFYILTLVNDFTTSGGTFTVYLDGTQTDTDPWTYTSTSYTNGAFTIGTQHSTGIPLDGDLAEIIVLDAVPSTTDRNNLISYLQTKYGL